MIYTRKDLIRSYLDAERYKSAAQELAEDASGFTAALQQAFQLSLSDLLAQNFPSTQWLFATLFKRGIEAIRAQETGVLEEGLLLNKLEKQGTTGQKLSEQYASLGRTRSEVTRQAVTLLVTVVDAAYPNAPETVTSEDLLRLGFDGSQRPDPMDYW